MIPGRQPISFLSHIDVSVLHSSLALSISNHFLFKRAEQTPCCQSEGRETSSPLPYSASIYWRWCKARRYARNELQRQIRLAVNPVTSAPTPMLAFRVSSRRVTAEACGFVSVRPHVSGSVPPCPTQSLFRRLSLGTDF